MPSKGGKSSDSRHILLLRDEAQGAREEGKSWEILIATLTKPHRTPKYSLSKVLHCVRKTTKPRVFVAPCGFDNISGYTRKRTSFLKKQVNNELGVSCDYPKM